MSHGFSWLPSWPCLQSRPWRQAHQGFSATLSSFKPDEILRLSMPVSSERAQEEFTQVLNFVDAMRNQVISQPLANLVYPSSKFDSQQLLLDFVGDLARNSKLMIHSDGRVAGNRTEMKDLLSLVAEFYLSRSSVKLERHLLLSIVNLSDAAAKLKAVVSKAALAASEAKSIFEAYMEAAEVMLEEDVASSNWFLWSNSYPTTEQLQEAVYVDPLQHCQPCNGWTWYSIGCDSCTSL